MAAAIWVRTSMQYSSFSTMRCRPRICPSMRRSRLRYASLSAVYPCIAPDLPCPWRVCPGYLHQMGVRYVRRCSVSGNGEASGKPSNGSK